MTEAVWKTVILSLIISLLILTVFCLSRGINTVFMHLYYFPIVLMAYHYHRKGILYTGVFCVLYLALVYSFTYPNQIEGEAGIIRAVVFLCVAAVVALLSENLEKQKAGYVALFESAEEALMKVDLASLSVVEVNPRLCEMLRCTPDQVKGSHLDRLWPDNNARRDFIRQLSLNTAVRSHESIIIAQDGSMHDVIVSAGILPGNNAIFTLTDVSEQKRAEKRMQALMQLHESIIMNANVWLMVLDPMGKVLIWNKAAENISGYRSDEVAGTTTVWKWIYPDKEYRKKVTRNIVNIIQTNNFFENLETTIRCKDGQERIISWNTRGLIDKAGVAMQFIAIGRDITTLKRAEEARKESEDRYRNLFESSSDAIMTLEPPAWRFTSGNPATVQMFMARDEAEFTSKEPWALSPERQPDGRDSGDKAKEMIETAMRNGTHFFEWTHKRLNGEDFPATVLLSRVELAGKVFLQATVRDITEPKQVEEALRKSEERFRTIIHSMQLGIVIIDEQTHTILDANQKALEMIGAGTDVIVGSVCHRFICPAESGRCPVTDLGQTVDSSERVLITLQGEKIPILKSVITTTLGGKKVLIESFIDITERKRAEKVLRESEDKYRRFFNTSHDCVFITSEDGRWVDLNDTGVELFGYAGRDELMRVKIGDLYADPDKRNEHIRIISETGFSKEYPVDLRKKDGTIMHTLVTTVARKDENGNVIGFQGTVRDISELKRAEEALIFAGKKLNLLNSITRHDINNQLSALDVFIHLSKDMTNDPAMRELLDKEANISAIIARQIAFTRDYQELGVNAPGWQNVHATILNAAAALPMRNVRIDVDCTDLEVFADPLFEKVFYNLLDNALRYGGDRLTTIRVSSHDTEAGLVTAFEDDGAGISAEDKKHLFERGFGKNTGLGLFLVREILSITRLSISETGEPGKGARFEISVPWGMFRFRKENGSDAGKEQK
jgi:PAS domain S-box-containing protein